MYAGSICINYISRDGKVEIINEEYQDNGSITVNEWVGQKVWNLVSTWDGGEWTIETSNYSNEVTSWSKTEGEILLPSYQYSKLAKIWFETFEGEI